MDVDKEKADYITGVPRELQPQFEPKKPRKVSKSDVVVRGIVAGIFIIYNSYKTFDEPVNGRAQIYVILAWLAVSALFIGSVVNTYRKYRRDEEVAVRQVTGVKWRKSR